MLSMTFKDEEKMTPGHYTLQNPACGLKLLKLLEDIDFLNSLHSSWFPQIGHNL